LAGPLPSRPSKSLKRPFHYGLEHCSADLSPHLFSQYGLGRSGYAVPRPGSPSALYGKLSDFGRSYVRPLYYLLLTIAAGVPFFWWHLSGFFQAVGHSFANTLSVFGFRKDLIDREVIAELLDLLKVVAASQTISGTVLLFLFGLAIWNRFRMK
jgi:hypothetical protein